MNPIEMLMQQAGQSQSHFAENSRYYRSETATGTLQDGRPVVYVRRRFLPQPEQMATRVQHTVVLDDRLDNLAHQYLGQPELFWQICDANRVLRPADLTDVPSTVGDLRVIRIGLPVGVPGPTQS